MADMFRWIRQEPSGPTPEDLRTPLLLVLPLVLPLLSRLLNLSLCEEVSVKSKDGVN